MFKKKSEALIGLDISSSSIKLLELNISGNTYHVDAFACQPLPPGIIVDKTINNPELLTENIARVVASAKTSTKAVAVAVPDSSVITKVLQMDADLTDSDIENQIAFEADKYIPYPLEEVSLDFTVLGENPKRPDTIDILLVACRSDSVNSRAEVLSNAGLQPKVVDVESYAIERASNLILEQLGDKEENKIIAVFDIGASITNLTVLTNNTTIFTREEGFGGDELLNAMMLRYSIDKAVALQKLQNADYPDDFQSLVQPFKESVVLQIRRALQFFFSASQHSEIHSIILAGGNAMLPGLPDLLQDQMGVATYIANPFKSMTMSRKIPKTILESYAPSLMLCCGLAMRNT